MINEREIEIPLDEGDVTFTVRGLSRDEWADLLYDHPTADPQWRWNQDTLNPELVRLCVIDPQIDAEFAGLLVDDLDIGGDLVNLCLELTLPGSLEPAKRRLANDARLAAEVAAAVQMGIPHSAFTAWPTRSQDLALAHFERASQVCPGCGVPESDMAIADAWEARVRSCWHCLEIEKDRKAIPEDQVGYSHVHLVRPDYYVAKG